MTHLERFELSAEWVNANATIEPMSEIEQIVEELRMAFEGEPWHGPALMEIVAGVDAKAASAHPIAEAHSIWELVLHIAAWERAINTRIVQRKALQLNDEENFPRVTDASESAWRQTIEKLRRSLPLDQQ